VIALDATPAPQAERCRGDPGRLQPRCGRLLPPDRVREPGCRRRLWLRHSLDFRNDAVDAGEIGAGHSATALYAVMFRPNTKGRIATVQLRWEDPDTHKVTEIAP